MLSRIMFLYFLQRQGFLAKDPDYLGTQLEKMQRHLGENHFYHCFLLPLFREGLSKQKEQRSCTLKELLGNVPYLNDGLFNRHKLEQTHPHIQIPDRAFEDLFSFFNEYIWHLAEGPLSLRKKNEINPDILSYIFEKYINQKQMGAYYTKEDITNYIAKNTLIPALFERAEKNNFGVLASHRSVWHLLQHNPDRYFYPEVKKGLEYPLPPAILAGMDDVRNRSHWNKLATEPYALPTETWRDVIARRAHYKEVLAKIQAGTIQSLNDMVTANLDLYQFMLDIIKTYAGADLWTFYETMAGSIVPSGQREKSGISILDPACGSGAFLFAVLHILEVLYEACLKRMQALVSDSDCRKEHKKSQTLCDEEQIYARFRLLLAQVEQSVNRRYFILQSIIMNNLYGVDIMEEGVEICKLRLILKLLTQVEREEEGETLPCIDFNICVGNALVGVVSHQQLQEIVSRSVSDKIQLQRELQKIEQDVWTVARLTAEFRRMQMQRGVSLEEIKRIKNQRLLQQKRAAGMLHRYLAATYNSNMVEQDEQKQYHMWLASHQPFDWYLHFYACMRRGGFDVIIGNPPYIEYSQVRKRYQIRDYKTEACGNIYAFMCERALQLLHPQGRIGFVVPLSLVSTERMQQLQMLLVREPRMFWLSNYDIYPSRLFEGAKQRLTIVLTSARQTENQLLSTGYNRWRSEARAMLFPGLRYTQTFYDPILCVIPKFSDAQGKAIFQKLRQKSPMPFLRKRASIPAFYVHRIPYNYVKAVNFKPYFWSELAGEKKSEDYKPYPLADSDDAPVMLAILNSSLFFWWWYTLFEGYHCGKHEIATFPVALHTLCAALREQLIVLTGELMADFKVHSTKKECLYRHTGRIIYEEFYPRLSKPIIDRIDRVLSYHYELTEEEYDYITNYHLQYRLGQEPEIDK